MRRRLSSLAVALAASLAVLAPATATAGATPKPTHGEQCPPGSDDPNYCEHHHPHRHHHRGEWWGRFSWNDRWYRVSQS